MSDHTEKITVKEIIVERITIVDAQGNVRIRLGAGPLGSFIALDDEQGHRRMTLHASEAEAMLRIGKGSGRNDGDDVLTIGYDYEGQLAKVRTEEIDENEHAPLSSYPVLSLGEKYARLVNDVMNTAYCTNPDEEASAALSHLFHTLLQEQHLAFLKDALRACQDRAFEWSNEYSRQSDAFAQRETE